MTQYDKEIGSARARFFEDTKNHRMEVLHNDGQYRHLRFRNPQDSAYWFDLITTPYVLVFRGDGESYVFSRLHDMFRFFASGIYKDGSLHINPHYWAEKLSSKREASREYSKDVVWEMVKQHLNDWRNPEFPDPDVALANRVQADWNADDEGGYLESAEGARDFLSRWESEGAWFDTWEWPMEGYDWWYLWACFGIVWGIQQYLKAGYTLPEKEPETSYERRRGTVGRDMARMGSDVATMGREMVF